jgi:hypothetical protein
MRGRRRFFVVVYLVEEFIVTMTSKLTAPITKTKPITIPTMINAFFTPPDGPEEDEEEDEE